MQLTINLLGASDVWEGAGVFDKFRVERKKPEAAEVDAAKPPSKAGTSATDECDDCKPKGPNKQQYPGTKR
ncbi:hypothetical protein FOA52_001783 [Chlamydomonas sp. UWO 241]|nr:hypothetical protein FOA52_001783 [Chlamydomonas sp. UWO 241]